MKTKKKSYKIQIMGVEIERNYEEGFLFISNKMLEDKPDENPEKFGNKQTVYWEQYDND